MNWSPDQGSLSSLENILLSGDPTKLTEQSQKESKERRPKGPYVTNSTPRVGEKDSVTVQMSHRRKKRGGQIPSLPTFHSVQVFSALDNSSLCQNNLLNSAILMWISCRNIFPDTLRNTVLRYCIPLEIAVWVSWSSLVVTNNHHHALLFHPCQKFRISPYSWVSKESYSFYSFWSPFCLPHIQRTSQWCPDCLQKLKLWSSYDAIIVTDNQPVESQDSLKQQQLLYYGTTTEKIALGRLVEAIISGAYFVWVGKRRELNGLEAS